MATLSNLVVQITGNTRGLTKALDNSQRRVDKFRVRAQLAFNAVRKAATGFAIAGLAAVVGFGIASVKSFLEVGDELNKLSIRTGLTVEQLSALKFAAEQNDATLANLSKGLLTMAGFIFDASEGLSTAVRSFDALGLSVEDLLAMSPSQQFLTIANAIAALENPTLQAAIAQDIFGGSGRALLPLLKLGSEGHRRAHRQGS